MAPLTDEDYHSILTTELPFPCDPILQKYLSSRTALINEEYKQRSDSSFRQALSPIAKAACRIVDRIRDEEHHHVTTTTLTPDAMTKPKSWQIIQRLPKGGLLRAQMDALALANVDRLITLALETPGMCLSSSNGNLATAEARGNTTRRVEIRFRKNDQKSEQSIWSSDYESGTFVPLTNAADDYPEGGRSGFSKWLKARCGVVSRSDDSTTTTTPQTEKTESFSSAEGRADSRLLRGMLYYEPIFRKFLRHLLVQLMEDGLSWSELRLTFPLDYYRTGSESPEPDSDQLFVVIGQEAASYCRQATTTPDDPGQRPPFWGLRIIWSTTRNQDQRSIIEDADSCIATKMIWSDLVAGYDLADTDALGRSLTDMLPELFWFRKQCALEEVEIPFFLDAGGGIDGAGECNLFDALLLGTRRLGNAPSLYRHPRMMEAVKDKRILVESCLVPGKGDISNHPLLALIAQGVPCALSLGDAKEHAREGAGLGMTHQFWTALHAWESLGLAGIGSLAENSVRWAAFEDQPPESWIRDIRAASVGSGLKAKRLKEWAVEWERFCLWIVTEYGDDYGEGGDGDGDGDVTASAN
ncbi:hypothetical protein QC762_200460 [Podospora pseudocomata]|uniref:Adenosine deaminase domain-containing protein n=1 Tax=Podospora pseudocomata TaxID=2093779 RepID=A0ABR0GPP3_9PEZI|nr:hypothetical protein QC762_200460 [Podospora pseudocomata]